MIQACVQDVGSTPILPIPAGEVVVSPPGVVVPNNYRNFAQRILDLEVREDNLWMVFSLFWNHVLSYWRIRNENNILYITFEDVKKDLSSVIKKVADFMKVTYTENQRLALLDHLSVAKMEDNKQVNFEDYINTMPWIKDTKFILEEYAPGSWRETLELIKQFDDWTAKNLENTDFSMYMN